jgi:hypothetical protein
MIKRILIVGLLTFGLYQPVHAAAVTELGQSALRKNVKSGQYVSLGDIFAMIEASIEGELIDIRAFDADGLVYRVLIMLPDGKIVSMVVDAVTGEFLPPKSERAVLVSEAALAHPGKKLGLLNGNGLGQEKSNNAGGNGKGKGKGKSSGKGKK